MSNDELTELRILRATVAGLLPLLETARELAHSKEHVTTMLDSALHLLKDFKNPENWVAL